MGWNKTAAKEDAQIDIEVKNILNGEYYYASHVEVVNAKIKSLALIISCNGCNIW